MPGRDTDGIALAAVGAGALFLYSGITGKNILAELQAVVQGKSPATAPPANPITGGGGGDGSGGGTGPGGDGSGGAPPGTIGPGAAAAQAWARAHLADYGWGPEQMLPLISLWNGESGWRWNAQNPASPAYGIPQSDPGDKMATMGADWRTNPVTQMRWGLKYIKETYGTPAEAWRQWQSRSPHWY